MNLLTKILKDNTLDAARHHLHGGQDVSFVNDRNQQQNSEEDVLKLRMKQIFDLNDSIYNESRRAGDKTDSKIYGELGLIRDQITSVKQQLKEIEFDQNFSDHKFYLPTPTRKHMVQTSVHSRHNKSNYTHSSSQKHISTNTSSHVKHSHINPRPSIKQSLEFSRVLNRESVTPYRLPQFVVHRHSQNYVFCYFARLLKSPYIKLVSRNKIQLSSQNKVGDITKSKEIALENEVLTSMENLDDVEPKNQNYLIMGCKSSGKWNIMKQLTIKICSTINVSMKIRLHFQILGSVKHHESQFIRSIIDGVEDLGKITCHTIDEGDNLPKSLAQFWSEAKHNSYYLTKKLLQAQQQIEQNGGTRKFLNNLLQNDLNCLKILCIEQYSDHHQEFNWIICSNEIPEKNSKWKYGALMQENRMMNQGGSRGLLNQALERVKSGIDFATILTINPLRYRLEQSLKVLDLIDWLECKQPTRDQKF